MSDYVGTWAGKWVLTVKSGWLDDGSLISKTNVLVEIYKSHVFHKAVCFGSPVPSITDVHAHHKAYVSNRDVLLSQHRAHPAYTQYFAGLLESACSMPMI